MVRVTHTKPITTELLIIMNRSFIVVLKRTRYWAV